MIRRPPSFTLTDTLVPFMPLFRSLLAAELGTLGRALDREVVDGEGHLARELVDVGGVVGGGPLVVAAAGRLGPASGLDLALAPVLGLGPRVDDEVGQVEIGRAHV